MKKNSGFDHTLQMELLQNLKKKLIDREKLQLLEGCSLFKTELAKNRYLATLYQEAAEKAKIAIASIVVIKESDQIFRGIDSSEHSREKFWQLVQKLVIIEEHYEEMGGIIGYHFMFLHLLQESNHSKTASELQNKEFLQPVTINFISEKENLAQWIRWGIESLPQMAEIYPAGGAGDRMGLCDASGEGLPVAALPFTGLTLLECLIRDLQAKEYLYYKLIGKQVVTPIVMMASEEKNNQKHLLNILNNRHWFGRGEENFFSFIQPLVPVITVQGHWAVADLLTLHWKPGGHGALWKLAQSSGAFCWLKEKGRKQGLIRQINNPIAGTDFGLLAFCGIGAHEQKTFGFSSCPRLLNTAEGMLVLLSKEDKGQFEYKISNIEYTDFAKNGLKDLQDTECGLYSRYPTNTNLLFVDLEAANRIAAEVPFSGMVTNCKSEFSCVDAEGKTFKVKAGRLESTMQSLSDRVITISGHPFSKKEHLASKAYVTYGERRKTISVAKNAFQAGKSHLETPQSCFYEMLHNNYDILSCHCGFSVPSFCNFEEFIEMGPNLLFLFHPALGPLYQVIFQKIRGGKIHDNAELQLEIAELDIENLDLDGSLLITAENPLGSLKNERMQYGEWCGKCELKNVRIENKGIDRIKDNAYWKNEICRKESVKIILQGNAEFFAENVTFSGDFTISVPDGMRFTAVKKEGGIVFEKEKISRPTWHWNYSFGDDDKIILKKRLLE